MDLKELKDVLAGIKTGVDGLNDKYVVLDKRVGATEDMLRRRKASVPGADEGKETFSIIRMINAIASRSWKHAPFEEDVIRAAHQAAGGASFDDVSEKAAGTDVDSAGGFLVPPQVMTEIIDLLRSKTVVTELGATIMDGLVGSPVEVPKQTGGATGFWVAENSAITDSQQTYGQVVLRPHEAASLTKLSNRLLRLSNPSAERLVREDIAKTLARLVDLGALRGTGASGEPVGIVNEPGIGSVSFGTAGGPVTPEKLYDMILEIENADAEGDKMGWAFPPKVWNKIRKLRTDSGAGAGTGPFFFNQDDLTINPNKGILLGMPYRTTTQLPTNLTEGTGANLAEIILANWSDLIWATWFGLEILASRETSDAFEKNQTWVRAILEVDFGVRHAEAFVLANDVETA